MQGQTQANKKINIKSETSGKIIKISKSVGEKINKGDLIFKISEKDLVINLFEESLNANEVVVTGNKRETYIKDSPILTHIITSDDIENSSGIALID